MASFTLTGQIQRYAGALFGLKLGSATLDVVKDELALAPGATLDAKLDAVLNTYYGYGFGSASVATVTNALLNNLGIVAGQNGLTAEHVTIARDVVTAALNAAPAGQRGAAINDLLDQYAALASDPVFGAAATAWGNKVDGAIAYSSSNLDNAAIDAVDPIVTTFRLTTGVDLITGSASNDTFTANVVQNANGQQVNSLGSGDELNGGAGTDTLNAKVTNGAFAGLALSMPVQPETNSIEVVNLQAVWSDVSGLSQLGNALADALGGVLNPVTVNAKDMLGVNQLWSKYSDADLIVQNLTTKDNAGVARKVSDMTIGMAYTGNKDSLWDESDYTVYFDQDYLVPEDRVDTLSTAYYFLLDEDAELAGSANRLEKIDVDGIRFRVDGGDVVTIESLAANTAGTHAGFVAALQGALAAAKAAGTVPADLTITLDPTIVDTTFLDDGSESNEIPAIVVSTSSGATITPVGFSRIEDEIGEYDVYGRFSNEVESETFSNVTINVALEKVGLAGDGGALVIGSMNKTSDNEWGAVNTTTDTVSGITKFDVTVYGAEDKSSSLSGMHSTNNNLRIINIVTDAAQTGSFADLTIGNSNTEGGLGAIPSLDNANALKDIQTLDASGFKGDLTVFAALTREITAKYLDLVDAAADAPADDNVEFDYTGGVGNDSFNVAISANNGAFSGAVTREDFEMSTTIAGGAGNDSITLAIVNNGGNSGPDVQDANGLAYASFGPFSNEEVLANWYDNQRLNSNLRIDGGEGDDTIWTPGSGDVVIDAGTGNDAVYADNTGDKAVWALNVADADGNPAARWSLNNLQSDANDSYNLYKTDVVVTFRGFTAKVAVADVRGVATDLDINQAVKKAINSDPVLSKLLEAKDGPANTLVITSRIDGELGQRMNDVLDISLESPLASELTAGDLNQLNNWYGAAVTDFASAADAAAYFSTQAAVFNSNAGGVYNQVFALNPSGAALDGSNSLHTSDNIITPDLGNDVIVLGTGRLSNDTIVYEGFNNGTDSIVHFQAGPAVPTIVAGGSTATPETFTVNFNTLTSTSAGSTVTFNGGAAVSLEPPANSGAPGGNGVMPAIDVAREFFLAAQANGAVAPGWTLSYVPGSTAVTFTRTTTGNFDNDLVTAGDQDITAANFVFANNSGSTGGAVSISNYADGTDAYIAPTAAQFTINLNGSDALAAESDGGYIFKYDLDGSAGAGTVKSITLAYAAGDGALTLAAKAVAQFNASGDWVATTNNNGIVVVTAKVPGAIPADGLFVDTAPDNIGTNNLTTEFNEAVNNGLEIVLGLNSLGSAQVGTAPVTALLPASNVDYLDFTSYSTGDVDVLAVQVVSTGQNAIFGTAPAAVGQEWIRMTESTTNDGSYTIELMRENGATDVVVGTIGVADFGVEQVFLAENFLF